MPSPPPPPPNNPLKPLCHHPSCPLQTPHAPGLFISTHSARLSTAFGASNPPPEIWMAKDRIEKGEGDDGDFALVIGFWNCHFVPSGDHDGGGSASGGFDEGESGTEAVGGLMKEEEEKKKEKDDSGLVVVDGSTVQSYEKGCGGGEMMVFDDDDKGDDVRADGPSSSGVPCVVVTSTGGAGFDRELEDVEDGASEMEIDELEEVCAEEEDKENRDPKAFGGDTGRYARDLEHEGARSS